MTVLHQLRRIALRAGLDVQRSSATGPARLARLLSGRGVDCVLDVGANRGEYAEHLRRFGYDGAIHSFEPLPTAYEAMSRRMARDARWTASDVALGADDCTMTLNVAGNEGASSSVLPMLDRHRAAAPNSRYVGTVDVPVRRLDSIWDEIVPRGATVFIKVDVQGYESAVLEGAGSRLAMAVGLQLEISLVPLYEEGLSLRDALDRAEALGMQLVHVEPGFFDPATAELLQLDGVFMRW